MEKKSSSARWKNEERTGGGELITKRNGVKGEGGNPRFPVRTSSSPPYTR